MSIAFAGDNIVFVSATESGTPATLDFVERLVNTVDFGPAQTDEFATAEQLQSWLRDRGFDTEVAEADARRVRDFREALRAVLEANAGHGDPTGAWNAVAPYVENVRFEFRTSPLGFVPQGAGAELVIGATIAAVYEAIERGIFGRLKACADSTCRFAFFDESKNASGRWCSMASCGNRAKARRRRMRDKQVQPPS